MIVAGFITLLHIPKGMMFAIGLLSIIVAISILEVSTVVWAFAIKTDGVTPKLHCKFAPMQTLIPIEIAVPEIEY